MQRLTLTPWGGEASAGSSKTPTRRAVRRRTPNLLEANLVGASESGEASAGDLAKIKLGGCFGDFSTSVEMTVVGYSGLFFYKDRVLANPSVTVGDTFPCRDGFEWFGFYLLKKSQSTHYN